MAWHQPHRTPGSSSLFPAIPAPETEKATGEKLSAPHQPMSALVVLASRNSEGLPE